jgi:hypothetical protein
MDKVIEAARKLVNMVDEDEPGLETWHLDCEDLYRQLKTAIEENDKATAKYEIEIKGKKGSELFQKVRDHLLVAFNLVSIKEVVP